MTPADTAALVGIITALWPNAPKYRAEHIEAFQMLLGDCDPESVKQALASIAREGATFPPTAGELYARVTAIIDPTPDWGEAWKEAIAWVQSHGWPDPPKEDSFSHRAVWLAVERLGYQALCESNAADAEVWMGHFRRIYTAAVKDVDLAPAREQAALARADGPIAALAESLTSDSGAVR